ncbi:hypothetical protein FRC09_001400 [Ceratobasidium sp. 395]|nr:hypothetical protein FRC09_001400 [Ceratobasidium sp. 395]
MQCVETEGSGGDWVDEMDIDEFGDNGQMEIAGPSSAPYVPQPTPTCEDVNNANIPPYGSNHPPQNNLPEQPEVTYNELWQQSANGEWYRTLTGAGHKLRPSIPAFEKLKAQLEREGKRPWDPFASLDEWELAQWLVAHGISKSALDDFMKLRIIRQNITLSFTSYHTLYNRMKKLPGGPEWKKETIRMQGNRFNKKGKRLTEKLEVWFRDPIEVLEELLAHPAFANELVFEPRETYLDNERTERVYHEMWTGEWWMELQKILPYGATVVPLIFSSDKTCLTNHSGNKEAWPIYLTIGNIPKATRRLTSSHATVLIGYIPVSKLKCFTKGDARREAKHRLFHTCVKKILKSLEAAGRDGVEIECSDGWVRRCYPVLSAWVADYPEQCMIACCNQSSCGQCLVPHDQRGENGKWECRSQREAGLEIIAESLGIRTKTFISNGYKPVGCTPFWYDLPHCDIFSSLTPDLLHQLHTGLFKDHLFEWCLDLANDDDLVDERFLALPSHPSLVSFRHGVASLSQTTGRQHKSMEKSIVAVMSGLVPQEALLAVQAAIDFIMLASLTAHTTSTLAWVQDVLDGFHMLKSIFVEKGIRKNFNFPKIHALLHYVESIISRGSLDGFNTEIFERLHIEMAKNAYRATNKRDYMKQMTDWISRFNAIRSRDAFIQWMLKHHMPALSDKSRAVSRDKVVIQSSHGLAVTLPKNPSFSPTSIPALESRFGINNLFLAVQEFLQINRPDLVRRLNPHEQFATFVKANIIIDSVYDPYAQGVDDCLHAGPVNTQTTDPDEEETVTSQSDTVLVRKHPERGLEFGMSNHHVAHLRMMFSLPSQFGICEPLAYVEWYTEPSIGSGPGVELYRVSRKFENGKRSSSVIRLTDIRRTCRLLPDFTDASAACTENMLTTCDAFFVDRYLDEHSFRILY